MLLQIPTALLQITTMCYYKLRQLHQIITNYGNTLLQITAGTTIYDVITNYVVTLANWLGMGTMSFVNIAGFYKHQNEHWMKFVPWEKKKRVETTAMELVLT